MRRVIQDKVESEIAENILKGVFTKGDTIRVVKKGDSIDFLPGASATAAPQEEHEEEEAVLAE